VSRRAGAAAALILLLFLPARARATTEEFSTFNVMAMEEDDESVLDHLLTAPPIQWRDEWERKPLAIRMGQGCFTSGQWIIDSDLKLSTSIGGSARFEVEDLRYESDEATDRHTDLWLRFGTRIGTVGGYFRPYHDKSRQDFGFAWETGNDTLGLQSQVLFTIEDTFNNLWEFRQTRVGNLSEPYMRHPYEPALSFVQRQPHWRWELSGKWLTPSRKQVIAAVTPDSSDYRTSDQWGALGFANVEVEALGVRWNATGGIKQASSVYDIAAPEGAQGDDWRSLWRAELGARAPLSHRTTLALRGVYIERAQDLHPPLGNNRFRAIDRVVWLETWTTLTDRLHLRLGGMHDRISVDQSGPYPVGSYGTRIESRAYFGLNARFGNLTIVGVEGIELDPEPYDVWFVHDKGFLSFQATF
jgi:hypothetical protein